MSGDPLLVACPVCQQPAGQPCLYLPINSLGSRVSADPTFAHYRSPAVQRRMALVGTPMPKGHMDRQCEIDELEFKRRRRAAYAARRKQRRADRELAEVRRALRDFERQEHLDLCAWLIQHGHILWET